MDLVKPYAEGRQPCLYVSFPHHLVPNLQESFGGTEVMELSFPPNLKVIRLTRDPPCVDQRYFLTQALGIVSRPVIQIYFDLVPS